MRRRHERVGRPIAILQDLQGAKMRTGKTATLPIHLEPGASVPLTARSGPSTPHSIRIDHPGLPQKCAPDELLLRDGGLACGWTAWKANMSSGGDRRGRAQPHKGIHFPGLRFSAALTEKDLADLRFGLEQDIDAVAISFVRQAEDVRDVREVIRNRSRPPSAVVIAKLERREALDELDGILAEADGVMVARGDLGVETSAAACRSCRNRSSANQTSPASW